MSQLILTQEEVKQYITSTLLAFRQDLERDLVAGGEFLEVTSDFCAVLYELSDRFELAPHQKALVCSIPVCRLYEPPTNALIASDV